MQPGASREPLKLGTSKPFKVLKTVLSTVFEHVREEDNMQKLLLFALLALPVWAQNTITPVVTAKSVQPGSSVVIHIVGAGPNVVAAGWTLAAPTGVTFTQVVGNAASTASKTLSCNPTGTNCLISGLNVNVVPPGEFATVTATLAPTVPLGTPLTFALTKLSESDASGSVITVTAGPAAVVPVKLTYDTNGDGTISAADYVEAVGQTLGINPCASGDVNGDGVCSVSDVVLVIRAVLGI